MSDQPIRRSNYDPPDSGFNCVNDGRALDADFRSYHAPLAELHNRALHGSGIADGLEVGGVIRAPSLQLKPGAAVDSQGRMIVLPLHGTAGLAAGDAAPAFQPYTNSLTIPTTGPKGSYLLTIGFHEELVGDGLDIAPCKSFEQRPILRIRPAGAAPDDEVVLAAYDVDANGALTSLAAGARQAIAVRVGAVQFVNERADSLKVQREIVGTFGPDSSGAGLFLDTSTLEISGDLTVKGHSLLEKVNDLSVRLAAVETVLHSLYDGKDLHPAAGLQIPATSRRRLIHLDLTRMANVQRGPLFTNNWSIYEPRNSVSCGLSSDSPYGTLSLDSLPRYSTIRSLTIKGRGYGTGGGVLNQPMSMNLVIFDGALNPTGGPLFHQSIQFVGEISKTITIDQQITVEAATNLLYLVVSLVSDPIPGGSLILDSLAVEIDVSRLC